MNHPSYALLYVADVPRSAQFYARLLALQPVESSPGFALFVLPTGLKIGLWSRADVQPPVTAAPGGSELCMTVGTAAEVDAWVAESRSQGWPVLQSPTTMDFGYTTVVADPDGHRLRVFATRT
ncbi:drug:proton antiporter [Hylemonella gracilis]|jgi:catechol 2,3-dioxygenase-like lactoylglutathione lyase family enzyme|uniref:Drug:proton antiporter n=1 Tax=Hylemonella gracilis TaxID=80880 RepID=A0A4P6UHU3_9BURK|nr:VOC family protein [Hylemonella gracilis]QBK03575.1 drug:proton antiporter [Hylemonella gracilis]